MVTFEPVFAVVTPRGMVLVLVGEVLRVCRVVACGSALCGCRRRESWSLKREKVPWLGESLFV
jgi:hypothetical protein